MIFSPNALAAVIERELAHAGIASDTSLCVALSGGPDSVALLAALAQTGLRGQLRALHVNHGLQAQSPDWASFCSEFAAELGIDFGILNVELVAAAGDSVEEAAREARYAALEAALERGECLVTAQHADDQVETLLLQLMRGAGLAGLACMPTLRALGRGYVLRPLLNWQRAELLDYLQETGRRFVSDPHNEDVRFDRVYLRRTVTPVLRRRWPALVKSVGRSVRHIAEAQGLLSELARIDLRYVRGGGATLSVPHLLELRRARQRNLLRAFVTDDGRRAPPARRLEAFLDAIMSVRAGSSAVLEWSDGALRRFGERIHLTDLLGPMADMTVRLRAGDTVSLPARLGELRLQPGRAGRMGLRVPKDGFDVRFRRGGERIRLAGRGGRRALKALLREAGVVPWMRERLPLLYDGEMLAAVADLWVAVDYEQMGGPVLEWRHRPVLR